MKTLISFVLITGLAVVAGCDPASTSETSLEMPQESASENDVQAPAVPEPNAPAVEDVELSVSGELAEVDPELSMLSLVFDDGTRTMFQYNEGTEIIGASGVQGLSDAQEGTRATIRYDDSTMPPSAISIEIVESPPPQL